MGSIAEFVNGIGTSSAELDTGSMVVDEVSNLLGTVVNFFGGLIQDVASNS